MDTLHIYPMTFDSRLHLQRHHLEASTISQKVAVPVLELVRACT